MDEIDMRILKLLQQDARRPLKEIGEQVSLSLPAARERVRKLEREGYISGYTAVLDPSRFDRRFLCFCLLVIRQDWPGHERDLYAFARERGEVLECHRVTGAYEYLLKLRVSAPAQLEALLKELRVGCGVQKSSTYTVLSSAKEAASIPPFLQA